MDEDDAAAWLDEVLGGVGTNGKKKKTKVAAPA
jgi:hypothetical protein